MPSEKVRFQVYLYDKSFLDLLDLVETHELLVDLGGGDGRFGMELKKHCNKIIILDSDKKTLKGAESKGFKTVTHDLNKPLPFADNSVDGFVLNQVLEHIYDTDLLISELYRSLKKGGKVYVNTPNLGALHNRIFLMLGRHPTCCSVSSKYGRIGSGGQLTAAVNHIRVFSFPAIKQLFKIYKFKQIHLKGSGFYPFKKFSSVLSKIFPTLCVYIIAVFEK